MQSVGFCPIWSECEQLCIILQMKYNTAFVSIMSSLGRNYSHNGKLQASSTKVNQCQLSVIMRLMEVKIRAYPSVATFCDLAFHHKTMHFTWNVMDKWKDFFSKSLK